MSSLIFTRTPRPRVTRALSLACQKIYQCPVEIFGALFVRQMSNVGKDHFLHILEPLGQRFHG